VALVVYAVALVGAPGVFALRGRATFQSLARVQMPYSPDCGTTVSSAAPRPRPRPGSMDFARDEVLDQGDDVNQRDVALLSDAAG
jgi:hypothetical protein